MLDGLDRRSETNKTDQGGSSLKDWLAETMGTATPRAWGLSVETWISLLALGLALWITISHAELILEMLWVLFGALLLDLAIRPLADARDRHANRGSREYGGGIMPNYGNDVPESRSWSRASIQSLIAALGSDDGLKRQRARGRLVALGTPAVAPLMALMNSPEDKRRWEAVKALGEIRDGRAAPALVTALQDRNGGIRWLAAEGLIAIGREGLGPLLQALVDHSESVWLRQGAHHVLGVLINEGRVNDVASVLVALEDIEPVVAVMEAAHAALDQLKG